MGGIGREANQPATVGRAPRRFVDRNRAEVRTMARYKAALILLIRKMFSQKGRRVEDAFLEQLTPEETDAYISAIPLTWLPDVQAASILQKAAKVLFPDEKNPLFKLGREEAIDNLRGVYKVFAKIASVPMITQQVAKIWRVYHDQGKAWATLTEDQTEGMVVVEGYPEFPPASRVIFAGFISGALEVAGAKDTSVRADVTDPGAWKWSVQIKK